jgi:pantetheine-phosphate adenylyltransferase
MKNTAVYPGTFDPFSNGHLDLVQRALKLFDRVIIAISNNPGKNPLFSVEERLRMIQQLFLNHPQVEVRSFNGLLVNFMKEQQATIAIRGIRTLVDIEYEKQLANMNKTMYPEMETLFLTSAPAFTFISSTLIREIALSQGDTSTFVPEAIQQAIVKNVIPR